MRRIETEKDREKKRRRNSIIISVILLGILILSTVGYAIIMNSNPSSTNAESLSGVAQLIGNRWYIQVDSRQLSFANSPESVKDISVPITSSIFNFQSQPVYIVSDNTAVNSEIVAVLTSYSVYVQRACYGQCEEDLPEKDCSEKLIVWTDGPESKIYSEENCIFIEGDLRTVDAFLFKILNIPVK